VPRCARARACAAPPRLLVSGRIGTLRKMPMNSWKRVILLQDVEKHVGRAGATGAGAEPSPPE